MIVFLLLDLFFYNYTTYNTCFFLLPFFRHQLSFWNLFFIGCMWDFFVIHSHGFFLCLLLFLFLIHKTIKGSQVSVFNFLVKSFLLFFSYFIFGLLSVKFANLIIYFYR